VESFIADPIYDYYVESQSKYQENEKFLEFLKEYI